MTPQNTIEDSSQRKYSKKYDRTAKRCFEIIRTNLIMQVGKFEPESWIFLVELEQKSNKIRADSGLVVKVQIVDGLINFCLMTNILKIMNDQAKNEAGSGTGTGFGKELFNVRPDSKITVPLEPIEDPSAK